jgi:hypothetical protein
MGDLMELIQEFANSRDVAVVAPAGCGKTNLIATATTKHNTGHELILTHTHAGVYAIRDRLRQFGASPSAYSVDTIAGWSFKYSSAYPAISGLSGFVPGVSDNWEDVYLGMARLLKNGTIREVVRRSYTGAYVDEYQDCLSSQHSIVRELATLIPCRIVGDPLQSIFGFGTNVLADWESEVMSSFKTIGELKTPWRWAPTNPQLGKWLSVARERLLAGEPIELKTLPGSIRWIPGGNQEEVRRTYFGLARKQAGAVCIIHGGFESQCHTFARNTGGVYNSMETIECKDLMSWASRLEASQGTDRAEMVWQFAADCCSGVKTLSGRISRHLSDKTKRSHAIPEDVLSLLRSVASGGPISSVRPALEAIRTIPGVNLFRAELYREMCRTLAEFQPANGASLQDCAVVVRERTRQFGRRIAPRVVSRTLLIKGLEFDDCMVIGADALDRNNLYVALTRASKTLTIVAREPKLQPPNRSIRLNTI